MALRYTFLCFFFLPLSVFARDAGVPTDPAPPQSISYQVQAGSNIEINEDENAVVFFTADREIVFGNASGEPNLPSVWVNLVLPEDTVLGSVAPRLSNLEIEPLTANYPVMPVPLQRTTVLTDNDGGTLVSEELLIPDGVDEVTGQNTTIYNADAFWPETWLGAYEVVMEGDFPIVRVQVNLAKVNPNPAGANNDKPLLNILRFAILHVDYELREPPGGSNQSNPPTQPTDWLVYNVDNGQALGEPSAEGLPGYLIITSSDIYSDASSEALQTKNALDAFKAHKESRGFNVVIQTEEAWLTYRAEVVKKRRRI